MITLYIACSRLSDSGEDTKERDTRKVGGAKKRKRKKPLLSPVSSRFIFVFALSQFSGPDYLRAWNRLHCTMKGKVDGLWNKIFMGIFRSTLHVFFLFLWPLWLNHTHSKTDDITRSRRELDRHGGGGGGRHGWFRRECRNTLKPYLLPPILSPFFVKMCWRTLKRDSLVLFSSPPTSNTCTQLCNRANRIRFRTKNSRHFCAWNSKGEWNRHFWKSPSNGNQEKYPPCEGRISTFSHTYRTPRR